MIKLIIDKYTCWELSLVCNLRKWSCQNFLSESPVPYCYKSLAFVFLLYFSIVQMELYLEITGPYIYFLIETLVVDILALCSRMRAVIMVDYGGKMPELKDQLCSLIRLCHKVSSATPSLPELIHILSSGVLITLHSYFPVLYFGLVSICNHPFFSS